VVNRRGQRSFRLTVEGKPLRLGYVGKKVEALRWVGAKLNELGALSSRQERLALSAVTLKSMAFPFHLPHQVQAKLILTYPESAMADEIEQKTKDILGKGEYKWRLERISDRPPMRERRGNKPLVTAMTQVAQKYEIPLEAESSAWPSVAGLVSQETPVVCGLAPLARDLYTPHESVQRLGLFQRTLLLAEYLAAKLT